MDALLSYVSHPVAAVIILLGLLVFVHEAGHFVVGKLAGIGVEVFSIGFGPVLAGFKYRDTHYRISVIPLGGFVKFVGAWPGEDIPEDVKGTSFGEAALWKRALVVFAGPFANILLAIVCYSMMGWSGISQPPPFVGEVIAGGVAESAGLQHGDIVTDIDGKEISTWRGLQESIYNSPGNPVTITVLREGSPIEVTLTPEEVVPSEPGRGNYGQIGISPASVPPIITISDPGGIGAKAGMQTGDRIVSMGDVVSLKNWNDLRKGYKEAGVSGLNTVDVQIKRNDKTLALSIPVLDVGLSGLGVEDSQLTVKKTKEYPDENKIKFGDRLVSWDGERIANIFAFSKLLRNNLNETVKIGVHRNGAFLEQNVKLKPMEVQKVEGKVTLFVLPVEFIGQLESPEPILEQYTFIDSWGYGVKRTVKESAMVAGAIGQLVTGNMPLKALGGPISIAKVASDSVKMGWMAFFSAMAIISINLALLNMVPIPVLDGGQLAIIIAEAVRRKPLPMVAIENFQKIGFVMVLSLVAMATYNDLSRFWSSMLKGVAGWF